MPMVNANPEKMNLSFSGCGFTCIYHCGVAVAIKAIICSCFIPIYCGIIPPKYRGVTYVDGGLSNNQPKYDEHTIAVSPFAGENDICPRDIDSTSLLLFDFTNTSIRFTSRNLLRVVCCLCPASPEDCVKMCMQGFEDALRFLNRAALTNCMQCLRVQREERERIWSESSCSDSTSCSPLRDV